MTCGCWENHSRVSAGAHGTSFSLRMFNQCSLELEAKIGSNISAKSDQCSEGMFQGASKKRTSSNKSKHSRAMHNLFQKTLFPHATKIQSSEHLYKRYTGKPVDGPGPLRLAGVITFSPLMSPVACIAVDPA